MNIKKSYYYLFYKFYKLGELSPSIFPSDFISIVVILWLEMMFLLSLKIYYREFINPNDNLRLVSFQTIGILSILIIIKYVAFIRNTKWKKYAKEFNQLPEAKNDNGTAIVIGIVLFVISNLIFACWLEPGGKH
jgi:uncharacterized membrane protein YbhN (UPF0104 family)